LFFLLPSSFSSFWYFFPSKFHPRHGETEGESEFEREMPTERVAESERERERPGVRQREIDGREREDPIDGGPAPEEQEARRPVLGRRPVARGAIFGGSKSNFWRFSVGPGVSSGGSSLEVFRRVKAKLFNG
jgi:hypothetical protein